MAAILKVEILCDGCGLPFDQQQFDSVSVARAASAGQDWKTVRLFNRLFDFCPACQDQAPAEAMFAGGKLNP